MPSNYCSYDAYATAVNQGLNTTNGYKQAQECTYFENPYGPNIYGNNDWHFAPLWSGTVASLYTATPQEWFRFTDTVHYEIAPNTYEDIAGVGWYCTSSNPNDIYLCPVAPDGTFMTQYSGAISYPGCSDIDLVALTGDIEIGLFATQVPNQGYMISMGVQANVDQVAWPNVFLSYSKTIGFWYMGASIGNEIYQQAMFGKYWKQDNQTPDQISDGGGGGAGWRPDYELETPATPSVSIIDTGMYNMYHVSASDMQSLASYLWSSNFFDNILKNFQSPMENIISLHLVPINVNEVAGNIKIGNLDSGVSSHKVTTSYYTIDFGSVYIKPIYKSFADYDTRITLFLPFIGYEEIDISDLMGGNLYIHYNVDVYSGECAAYVEASNQFETTRHAILEKKGNCALQFPISGANYMSVYTGAIGSIVSGANGNIAGAATGLMSLRPQYGKGGSMGGAGGYLAHRYPYIIYHSPVYEVPDNYNSYIGGISNIYSSLASCSGWTVVKKDCYWASEIKCTEEEKTMIKELLESGVYINS